MANTEGAFTLSGFESPEQVRRRIMGQQEAAFQAGLPQEALPRAAGVLGRRLGETLVGAFGGQRPVSPEEQLATQRQQFLSDIDLTDRNQLITKSREALQSGDVQLGGLLADRALQIDVPKPEKVEDKDTALMRELQAAYGEDWKGALKRLKEAEIKRTGSTSAKDEDELVGRAAIVARSRTENGTPTTTGEVLDEILTVAKKKPAKAPEIKAPTKQEEALTTKELLNLGLKDDLTASDWKAYAAHVASEAKKIQLLQPGQSWSKSVLQAHQDAITNKILLPGKRERAFGFLRAGSALDLEALIDKEKASTEQVYSAFEEPAVATETIAKVKRFNPATGRIEAAE